MTVGDIMSQPSQERRKAGAMRDRGDVLSETRTSRNPDDHERELEILKCAVLYS